MREADIILKSNEKKVAFVIKRYSTVKRSVITYKFRAKDNTIYDMDLAVVPLDKKYIPKLGDAKVIITSPELNTCLLGGIEDKQIFSYKVLKIGTMIFGVVFFIVGMFGLIAMVLEVLGKIK